MPKTIHRPEYDVLLRLIRQAREDVSATQTEISIQLGRSQSFLSDIERGVRRIDALELRDLCGLLGQDFLGFMAELEDEISKLPTSKQVSPHAKSKRAHRRK